MEERGDPAPASPAHDAATSSPCPTRDDVGGPSADRCPARRRPAFASSRASAVGHPETVLPWHQDILCRRWARKSRRKQRVERRHGATSVNWCNDWPRRTRLGLSADPWRARGLGISIAPSTVWQVLTNAGIPPAPRRAGPTWAQFLSAQAEAILAVDFFTVDLLDGTSAYVLAVIEHATRRIRILGVTAHPTNAWATQIGRNLMMDLDAHLEAVTFLLRDRDTKFSRAFEAVFTGAGIRILRSPIRAPRANAIMERWIGGCRGELLDQTLIWNHRHLRQVQRVRNASQRPPTAPLLRTSGSATGAIHSGRRSRQLPCRPTRPGRRCDPRIHARGMTRTR
jgi:hypothetical protein